MKNQIFFRSVLLALAFTTLAIMGCDKGKPEPFMDKSFRLEANLMMDKQLFSKRLEGRHATQVFEILEINRDKDLLEVRVKGGSNAEAFQFVWDGRVQESFPMGIRLMMLHDGNGGAFDAEKEITVSVNLQRIIGDRNQVDDYHFHVINGSKIQTVVLNPDGTSTNEAK